MGGSLFAGSVCGPWKGETRVDGLAGTKVGNWGDGDAELW